MKQTTIKSWRNQHIEQTINTLGITRNDYRKFLIIGNRIHKRLEYYCNGYMGNEPQYVDNKLINRFEDAEYEAYITPLMDQATKMAKDLGLEIFFQTDPRGATIYLDKKPIKDNSYTDAYCVY